LLLLVFTAQNSYQSASLTTKAGSKAIYMTNQLKH